MCEAARAERAGGREVDAFALCLMARSCDVACVGHACPVSEPLKEAV
jgi:hypothetical protein